MASDTRRSHAGFVWVHCQASRRRTPRALDVPLRGPEMRQGISRLALAGRWGQIPSREPCQAHFLRKAAAWMNTAAVATGNAT